MVLGGTGSVLGATGRYFVVLGQNRGYWLSVFDRLSEMI